MLFSATVHNSLVTQEKCRLKGDNIKFRIDLVQGLLVKHLVQHKVSDHHDGDNTVKRLTVCHFPRKISLTEKKWKLIRWCCLQQGWQHKRQNIFYWQDCDVAVCIDGCFDATIQGKIIDKMKVIYYIQSIGTIPSVVHLEHKIQKLLEIKLQAICNI